MKLRFFFSICFWSVTHARARTHAHTHTHTYVRTYTHLYTPTTHARAQKIRGCQPHHFLVLLFVFIFSLFYDTIPANKTLNDSKKWMMNWKGFGRGLILKHYPGIRMVGLRKTTKNLRIASLQAKIWTRDPPEYEAGVVSTRRSLFLKVK
jgi:hypothetical protein